VPGARRRIRDGFDGEVAAGASLADEELDEVSLEGEAEEDEVLCGADDAGVLTAELELGAVDAEVGDVRPIWTSSPVLVLTFLAVASSWLAK
jgi:hypothetical protein